MLKKELRINTKKEYNNIYKYGKKIPARYIIVFIMNNYQDKNRFGVVVSKKVGNAVHRNRIKRQLRAIVKDKLEGLKGGYDIVIIARKTSKNTLYDLLEKDFLQVMKRAGLCLKNL